MPTTSTEVSRLKLLHPDLGHDGGTEQHTELRDGWTKIGDNMNSRFFTEDALANAASVDFDHNFKTAFAELRVNLFTRNIGDGELTRIEKGGSPDLDDFTIAATPGSLTTQVRITNNTGGPVDLAAVVVHGKGAEVISDLEDVDTVTTPPTIGQSLVWDGSNFVPGASAGGGEVNFIANPNAEADTTGWAAYADAAGATPVDGTGGSPTVTWTVQSGVSLRGTQSFKLTKDAADRQGEGASYDFTIGEQDTSRKLKIAFDFKTDEDAGYAAGDLTVYIYDVTNAQLLTPHDVSINRTTGIFQTSFDSTTSTSYRLIFHIATANASAWDAYIDNVIVGPGMTSQGAVVGPWESFTSVIEGSGSNPTKGTTTTDDAYFRRVGESMEIQWSFHQSGAGTAGSGFYKFIIPNGLTIDSSKTVLGLGTIPLRGAAMGRTGSTYYTGWTYAADSTSLAFVLLNDTSAPNDWGSAFLSLSGTDARIGFFANIPILEWAGKGIVPMLAEDNLSQWQDFTPGSFIASPPATTLTLLRAKYRRSGDILKGRVTYAVEAFDYAGSAQAANVVTLDRIIPSGLTVSSGITNDARNGFGTAKAFLGGTGDASKYADGFIEYDTGASGYRFIMGLKDTGTAGESARAVTWEMFGNPSAGAAGGFITFEFDVPIDEWAGSQNSLVGYTEADFQTLGLVKKNRWQRKDLTSDISVDTDPIAALSFSGLTVGKSYRMSVSGEVDTSGANTRVRMLIKHNGSDIAASDGEIDTAGERIQHNFSIIFTAAATTVDTRVDFVGGSGVLEGTITNACYAILEELNNFEAETTAFT